MSQNEKRYGFVGIIMPNALGHGPTIQKILSDHAAIIQGRMGLPHLENGRLAVITLIVCGTTDELGSLTGRLGRIAGITVKSGLAPADVLPDAGPGVDMHLSPTQGGIC